MSAKVLLDRPLLAIPGGGYVLGTAGLRSEMASTTVFGAFVWEG